MRLNFAVTVDCVVFGMDEKSLQVLLIQRKLDPFKGKWALPGGFVYPEETLLEAASRELREETGIINVFLEQLYTFGNPHRDPRGSVVSVSYYGLISLLKNPPFASTDASRAAWFDIYDLPELAFDHRIIFEKAHERLKGKLQYEPIGFELLPSKFTLSQLQKVYEIILEKPMDKRNFRRKILAMGLLLDLQELQEDVNHRAAKLYSFNYTKYQSLRKQGFLFEI